MTDVLVVDDTADVRLLIRSVLSQHKMQVSEAASGTAALAMLMDGVAADVLLLDVQMPELDGWDTLAAIRAHPRFHAIAVVMCSVKGHPEDQERAWVLGCDGYIDKPFSVDFLVGEVQSVADRSIDERKAIRRAKLEERPWEQRAS